MAYLGDIRENSISPEGIIWENDNRKDARYYWNGAFIDLCDLPGEDYAKTIFVTSGSSNEPSTPSKQKNPITIQETEYMNENGEMFYAYKAVATQAVTSEVVIEMSISDQFGDTEKITIKISVGSNESEVVPTSTVKADGVKRPEINTSKYSPLEDETFKYNIILPEEPIDLPMAYSITMLSGEIDTISDVKLIEMLRAKGEIAMKDKDSSEEFLVEFTPIAVEGFSNMSVAERKAVLKANVQDIIIVTDKPIKDIMLAGVSELEVWTKRQGNVVIDNVTYDIWYKRDEGQIAQSRVYDPVTGELSMDNSVKYIIYYE